MVSPVRAVTRTISFGSPVEEPEANNVAVKYCPAAGFGNRAPVPLATVMVVAVGEIALPSVVEALFANR